MIEVVGDKVFQGSRHGFGCNFLPQLFLHDVVVVHFVCRVGAATLKDHPSPPCTSLPHIFSYVVDFKVFFLGEIHVWRTRVVGQRCWCVRVSFDWHASLRSCFQHSLPPRIVFGGFTDCRLLRTTELAERL